MSVRHLPVATVAVTEPGRRFGLEGVQAVTITYPIDFLPAA